MTSEFNHQGSRGSPPRALSSVEWGPSKEVLQDGSGREGNRFADRGGVTGPIPSLTSFPSQGSLGPPGPPGLGVSTISPPGRSLRSCRV